MEIFLSDVRLALKSLAKNRHSSLAAITALTLGIGATTLGFSVVYNLLFNPYPYRNADRLMTMTIHDRSQAGIDGRSQFSIPEFLDFREHSHVFEDMVGSYDVDILYIGSSSSEVFTAAYVTTNTFNFYGVQPLLGRGISPQDGEPGAPPVFVMNYKLWRERFNGAPGILGTSFSLDGEQRTLVGVMPPRFQAYGVRLWLPLKNGRFANAHSDSTISPAYLWAIGRLKSGVSLKAAAADLNVTAKALSTTYPDDYPERFTVFTRTLNDAVMGNFKAMLYALLAAVFMLLLIACSNVASLLLVRATAREREIALRSALGASRFRLIRQLLTESFVLAAAGCVGGCVLAFFGLKGIMAAIPQGPLPDEAVIELNRPVFFFAVLIATLTALMCGLAPVLHAMHMDLRTRLSGTGKGVGGGFRHGKLRGALVIAEVALSVVLLVGSGFMVRTLQALIDVDLGFNPSTVLYTRLAPPKGRYVSVEQQDLLVRRILGQVQMLPGVMEAAESSSLPPVRGIRTDADVLGKTHFEKWETLLNLCSEGYFRTLEIRILGGRLLLGSDVDMKRHVVVVNRTLAQSFFGVRDAVGQKIKFRVLDQVLDAPHDAYFEIVGVVSDVANRGPQNSSLPEAFIPYTIAAIGDRTILVRTTNPNTLLPPVRRALRAVDSDVAVTDGGSIKTLLQERFYKTPEFGLKSLGGFASIGLALVLVGVFSALEYTVSLQTREIGIRTALGARQGDILCMVVLKGLRQVALGIVIGLFASFGLARLLRSEIWGVSSTDPWTFSAAVVFVVVACLVACLFPARRAARVDPLIALRYE